MKKWFFSVITFLFFIMLLVYPSTCLRGAEKGLLLWFQVVLPTLLPFIIISNLMVCFGITDLISDIVYPIIGKILRISKNGCYPVIIGLLSGYPIGAKACADMVKKGQIPLHEGQFLLCFCNNASPVFIISFIAGSCLKQPKYGVFILFIIIISGILSGFIYRLSTRKKQNINSSSKQPITHIANQNQPFAYPFQVLDDTIMNAFSLLVKIGGYIILFSILAEVIFQLNYIPETIRCFITGFLEITTGCNILGKITLNFYKKIILINFLTAFGGLSSHAQTLSVLIHSGLSIRTYFIFKLIAASITVCLTLLLINII